MRTKRKKPIIFILILSVIIILLIYLSVFSHPTYKIINDRPYNEAIDLDGAIYQRTYWQGDYWKDDSFNELIGFADSPKWGVYKDSDPNYSDFVVLKYHYSLDHRPQPIMLKKENSKILEPSASNTSTITFDDYKNPSATVHSQSLTNSIFLVLDTSDSITVADISTKRKHYGSIDLSNSKLSRLTFDLELILCKDTDTYYLGIYNQNKLVPIPKELGKELRGYLK